jgi:hypothetical protein
LLTLGLGWFGWGWLGLGRRGLGLLLRGEEVVRELEERVNNYDSSRVAPMYF